MRGGKGWPYEGGVREPLIIRAPGLTKAGITCDTPVITTDFYPTFLELAKLPPFPEQHRDGVSLVPLLKGKKFDRGPRFFGTIRTTAIRAVHLTERSGMETGS